MKPSIIVRIILVILIYSILASYITWNSWIWLHSVFGLENKWIFGFISVLFFYSYIIGSAIKKFSFFRIIGSYWFAFFQYALLLLPIADLAGWILIMTGAPNDTVITSFGAAVLVLFGILFIYGTYNAYSPIVRTYKIDIPKKAKHHTHLRIVMASDMHFGHLSGLAHLRRLVKGVNELQPDIILLPGDIVDDDPKPFIQKKMGDTMKELSAPLGVYGVLGNHEYYGRAIPEFVEQMERIGVEILQDQFIKVNDSFYLVGRKDKTDSHRQSIEDLMANIDLAMPVIMMDHQPTEIKIAEKFGVDLILSGHTHRGQMAPNHLITRKIFELDWGYRQFHQLHAIVSSGFGFWGPPIRIGSRSEIILIEVRFLELNNEV